MISSSHKLRGSRLKYLILLTAVIFLANQTYALTTEVKGFVGLDILKFYKTESSTPTLQTGIGTLDLKFYAYHDNISFKLKLDLDDSEMNEAYNLFEEANATYRITDSFKITAGKGLVPFNQKRYGIVESAYLDGGSPLGGINSWRDPDNKILIILTNGSYKQGYMNHFTFYGESKQIERNSDGSLKISVDKNGYESLNYKTTKDFQTKDQRGFANKLEFFLGKLTVYGSGIYYYNDAYPMDSWALDAGGRYVTPELEIWLETLYGFYSTHSAAKYPAFKQYEKLIQLGMEKRLNQNFFIGTNIEGMLVKKHTWQSQMDDHRQMKLEIGPKYLIRENAFVTFGIVGEKKKTYRNSVYKSTKHLLGTALKLSFWY